MTTDSKTYLNVPFAQKDDAKSLGARWDPAAKKWYVPAGKDVGLFARWMSDDNNDQASQPQKTRATSAPKASNQGAMTHPAQADFVAYSGDAPPWD